MHQMDPRRGNQRRQPCQEIQRLEDQRLGPVMIGPLQPALDPPVRQQGEPFLTQAVGGEALPV